MIPERMTKVRIAAPKTMMPTIIRELHLMKAVHIVEHSKSEFDIGQPMAEAEKLSEMLLTIRGIGSQLGIKFGKTSSKHPIDEIEKKLNPLHAELNSILEKKKQAEEKLKTLGNASEQLNVLEKLKLKPETISGYRTIAVIVGSVNDIEKAKRELSKITDKVEIHTHEKLIAAFIEVSKRQEALEALSKHGFNEIQLSDTQNMRGTAQENLKKIESEKTLLKTRIIDTGKQIASLRKKNENTLPAYESTIAAELERAEAPLKFAATSNAFVITGWVPSRNFISLKNRLENATSGKIYIKEEEPAHNEKVPVKLQNPKPAKPFEFLIGLRGLPIYDELDPTLAVFLTFPIFFGFILGDIGYGILTVILAFALMKKMPAAKKMLTIIAISGASSILFGFVFGEFFGEESIFGMDLPHLISRAHQINELLLLSLLFGIVHINIGLILGFINELKHGLLQAILEKASWFFVEFGALFLLSILNITQIPQQFIIPSGISLALGVIMLVAAEMMHEPTGAIKALIESISIFSNILSYARLMAVGLASVELALLVNEFAKEFFHQGGIGIIFGVLLIILGHTINFMLGLLGAFMHSLRLEYVEFFTKFFKGGAEPFKPFGEKN